MRLCTLWDIGTQTSGLIKRGPRRPSNNRGGAHADPANKGPIARGPIRWHRSGARQEEVVAVCPLAMMAQTSSFAGGRPENRSLRHCSKLLDPPYFQDRQQSNVIISFVRSARKATNYIKLNYNDRICVMMRVLRYLPLKF